MKQDKDKEKNKGLLEIYEQKEKYINDFIFEGYHDILVFYDNRVKRWDIRKFNEPVKVYENLGISSYLYDNKLHYLYSMQYNRIDIYKDADFDKKEQEIKISLSDNIILLDPCFLEGNEIANFLELTQFSSRIIKIKKEKFSNRKTVMAQPKQSLKKYLDEIVYKISDYSELLKYSKNIKKDEIIITPKYLDISELSNEFKSLETQSVFQRKQYVKDNLDKINNIKNSTDNCVFYLKFLIRDNTNTKLIKKYLSFLKENPQLETLNLDYKKELKYYMVCMAKSELNELKEEKENDEKVNLIKFLSKLYDAKENDFLKFVDDIKNKEIKPFGNHSFFNQPIEFANAELFFYKLKMNLYYRIMKMNSIDYKANFKAMKDYIKIILEKNYFNNNNITQNEEILDLLVFSINNTKINNNKIYADFFSLIAEKQNYNKLSNEMKLKINYTDIKTFLKSILSKKTIKELITFLYGEKYSSNFTKEYIDAFVDNYLKFVPFKGVDCSGFTDRFTLKSYIFLDQDINDIITINPNDIDKITKALKIGRAIAIILHELSHNFYSYILEFYNYSNLNFECPRKKFFDLCEEYYVELILFGRIINNINLEEVLCI